MSLLVVLPTPEGIVAASDSSFSFGQYRDRASKIFRLNDRVCWSAVGEYQLIQRVGSVLASMRDSSHSLKELLPTLASVVKSSVRDLLSMDFRTELYVNNLNAISSLHRADFVFLEWTTEPQIIHLQSTGHPTLVTHPLFIGAGDSFAGALFQRFRHISLNLGSANLLAYRLVEETVQSELFSLSAPLELWNLTKEENRLLEEPEIARIKEELRTLRQHEIAVFERYASGAVSQ